MKTIFVKDQDIQKKWYLIDAEGKNLGRVAAKVAVSGNKHDAKLYHHHSGYVGGLKTVSFEKLIERKPTEPLFIAIKGMLPNGALGRKIIGNLRIYAGAEQAHTAQNPEKIEL